MKKICFHRSFVTLAVACCFGVSSLQAQLEAAVETKFEQFAGTYLQEKIFAHTDRNFYLAGDLSWFKLYLVDGATHQPLGMSKVAYVEVLDQEHRPVVQAKIEMNKGEGAGSFFLPVTIHSGKYLFRAYTQWMKNAGPDFFFQKTVTIINPQLPLAAPVLAVAATEPDIRFFPEGGNLVAGISNRVACKITSPEGSGIDYRAVLLDANNNNVLSFASLHAGIGNFVFTPQAGQHYKVQFETGAGKFMREVPAALTDGTSMQLTDAGGRLRLHMEDTRGSQKLTVVVHTRQMLQLAKQVDLVNGKADIDIDKSKLPEGISAITLFDQRQQPVCERLYFTYPASKLSLAVQPDRLSYGSREKIQLAIAAIEKQEPAAGASLSLAVFRLDSLETIPEENIDNYLLLSSELKGRIETPQWYFHQVDDNTRAAMDNLMLTHGWRRFKWEIALQNRPPVFTWVPEFNGHLITGKITDSRTGKPAADIQGYLAVPGKRTQFYPSLSDEKGRLRFELKDMVGSSELVIQTNSQRDSLYKIDIDDPFSKAYSSYALPSFRFTKTEGPALVNKSIGTQVQNIFTAQQRQQFNSVALDSIPFYGKADATYYLDKYTRFITIEEVLREYVTYLDVQRSRDKFHIPLFDFTASSGLIPTKQVPLFPTDPLVLLDGVPLFDVSRLMALDARKIRKLEIFNHREFVRGSYFDGILNWQTYNGDLGNLELDPGAIAIDYEGLQAERIFYSPVYDTDKKQSSHLPDFRNLLQWNPSLHTDTSGKTSASFYSSDLKGRYAVIVQGITPSGKAGSGISFFEVR